MLKFLLIATLCLILAISANEIAIEEASEHRELRGGGRGGGGRSSSRSSSSSRSGYSSSSSSRRTTKMTSTTYRKTTNTYWNAGAGRTYHAFYVYYLPPNYYTAIGYYSPLYL